MRYDAFKARFTTEMLRALDALDTLDGNYDLGEIELGALRARVAVVEARTALLHLEVAYLQLELLENLTTSRTGFGTGLALCVESSTPGGDPS